MKLIRRLKDDCEPDLSNIQHTNILHITNQLEDRRNKTLFKLIKKLSTPPSTQQFIEYIKKFYLASYSALDFLIHDLSKRGEISICIKNMEKDSIMELKNLILSDDLLRPFAEKYKCGYSNLNAEDVLLLPNDFLYIRQKEYLDVFNLHVYRYDPYFAPKPISEFWFSDELHAEIEKKIKSLYGTNSSITEQDKPTSSTDNQDYVVEEDDENLTNRFVNEIISNIFLDKTFFVLLIYTLLNRDSDQPKKIEKGTLLCLALEFLSKHFLKAIARSYKNVVSISRLPERTLLLYARNLRDEQFFLADFFRDMRKMIENYLEEFKKDRTFRKQVKQFRALLESEVM